MKRIRNILYFSPEIVLGALASGTLATRVLKVRPGIHYFLVLGLLVFILYLADHLFDGLRYGPHSERLSHRYYFRKRKLFVLLIVLAVATALVSATGLKKEIFLAGLPLMLPLAFYYTGIHLFRKRVLEWLPGEIVVALLYTAGIWSGPLALAWPKVSPSAWIILLQFQLAILNNVFLISGYSLATDRQLGIQSLAVRMGRTGIRNGQNILTLLGLFLLAGFLLINNEPALLNPALILALITLLTRLTGYFPAYFGRGERYRCFADTLLILSFLSLLS
ncbi:MAG: hypothetical protein ACOYXB_02135 [Bacteroidota bacterium]